MHEPKDDVGSDGARDAARAYLARHPERVQELIGHTGPPTPAELDAAIAKVLGESSSEQVELGPLVFDIGRSREPKVQRCGWQRHVQNSRWDSETFYHLGDPGTESFGADAVAALGKAYRHACRVLHERLLDEWNAFECAEGCHKRWGIDTDLPSDRTQPPGSWWWDQREEHRKNVRESDTPRWRVTEFYEPSWPFIEAKDITVTKIGPIQYRVSILVHIDGWVYCDHTGPADEEPPNTCSIDFLLV